jgi:hypothetical protein
MLTCDPSFAQSLPVLLPVAHLQDNAASDSMEPAMALIHLNGITRTAVRLIKGMKLSLDESGHFAFGVFSVISWFKITERYVLGEPCQHRRRDLRRGERLLLHWFCCSFFLQTGSLALIWRHVARMARACKLTLWEEIVPA